jgi:hypothetical protein
MSNAFAAPENLAPPLVGKNSAGQEWTPVRTVDHAAPERDFDVRLKQNASLKIESRGFDSGYGEWRITPSPTLEKGATYVFAAALQQRRIEGSPPYLRVYSFDAAGTPRVIAYVAGKIGDSNWYVIQTKFQVPPDSAHLRFDAGLNDSRGAVYFGDFQLYPEAGDAPPPMLAETAQSTPATKWRADWIASVEAAENAVFSTTVELPQIPLDAFTQIAADGEWNLKVNRRFVAQGSSWGVIKSFDLAPFLNVGHNDVSIEVLKKGARAALLCQGDWRLSQNKTLPFQTDAAWATGAGKAVAVLGAPPMPPWGAVPLQNVAHFPERVVRRVEAPAAISTGATWTAKVFLTAPLPVTERENWTLQWTRDGHDALLSAVPAQVLPSADGTTLSVSSAVSAFATPGKYRWTLSGDNGRIVPAQNREVEISAATPVTKNPFRWPHQPANAMTVSGETGAPYMMNTARREVASYRNWTRATGLHLYEVWLPLSVIWKSPDTMDLSELEYSLLKILEADPKAAVNVILRFDMPAWWCRQNPAECYLSDKGKRSAQSFFSLRWREDSAAAMRLLKRDLDALPAANRIDGVVISGGEGGEFLLPGRTFGEYDASPAARQAFAAWCRKNSIAPPDYPNAAMQRPYPMDETSKAARRNIFHFFADWQADNLIFLSHRAKEIFGANFQVAAYYGYILELGDYRASRNGPRLMYSGHLGLQKVLDEGAFDCMMSISTYSLRKPGLAGGFMGPVDSVFLHGLTHLNENDIRTHLVKVADSSGAPADNLNQTRELYRREMLNAAQKGVAIRYHSLLRDVDFLQDPQILQFIGELGREVQTLKPLKLGDKNQVAFVVDDEALYDLTSLSTWETLPPQFLGKARDALARMDRPVAWLLWSDWVKNKDKFKTAIFPLPSLLSPEHRKQIEVWAGSTLPVLDDDSGALVADKTGAPSLTAFTDLNDLVRAVGGAGSGEGTPVRYIGENFLVDYAGGKFTPRQ